MTPAPIHLRARVDVFSALSRLYNQLANDLALDPIERGAYSLAADRLNDIEYIFMSAADDIEERDGTRLPFRRVIPIRERVG